MPARGVDDCIVTVSGKFRVAYLARRNYWSDCGCISSIAGLSEVPVKNSPDRAPLGHSDLRLTVIGAQPKFQRCLRYGDRQSENEETRGLLAVPPDLPS